MTDFKLNFKASNIAKAEDKYKKNFFTSMSNISELPSISELMFLFLAGGATEDEFDEILKNGGIEKAVILITEGLNESGFLEEKVDITELKRTIDNKKKSVLSNNSGKVIKP